MTRPTSPPTASAHEVPRRSSDIGPLAASAAKLLGSGLVSALALTIITSNRWHLLDPGVGVALVLFLQWQVLGLTVTKMGLDQIIFAAITDNPLRRPTTTEHMRRRALPLGLAFGVLVAWVFGPWVGLACFASLAVDTQSVFILADLTARERYNDVMIASLLNYPLFFLIVFGLQIWLPVTLGLALAVFVLTSFTRWAWLSFTRSKVGSLPILACRGTALTGVAPFLNFLMFRADQVLLGTSLVSTLVAKVGSDFVRQLLFVGRYQELLTGGLGVLAGILLPRLHITSPLATLDLVRVAARRKWHLVSYVLVMSLPLAAYSLLWRGSPLSPILLASGAVSALLILPANALTYSMIRQGHLQGLVRNLAVAVTSGLCVITTAYLLAAPMGIVLAVPLQLSVFVLLALTSSWLTHKHGYE